MAYNPEQPVTLTTTQLQSPKSQPWSRPTLSPEHGVYVMLVVSFLTGAAAAQHWTWVTTLALICAFCGFQAEHPLVLQVKQRHSWKPRFLLWTGLYGGVAGAIALGLIWQSQTPLPLLLIYGAVAIALVFDVVSVWHRKQKSILNELITFAAICLSTLLAYVATTGEISIGAIALWGLNTLFFSSAIFTVKLRKPKTTSIIPGLVFHSVATGIILALWLAGWLGPVMAAAFGVVLLKFTLIIWRKHWYCNTKIQTVALIETLSSLVFLGVVSGSLLPTHL